MNQGSVLIGYLLEHMGVDLHGHGRRGVAYPSRDDFYRDAQAIHPYEPVRSVAGETVDYTACGAGAVWLTFQKDVNFLGVKSKLIIHSVFLPAIS